MKVLRFGQVVLSPVYRAWLYWTSPFFCAWEVVACASDQCDGRVLPDPWCVRDLSVAEKRRRIVGLLIKLIEARAVFDEAKLRALLTLSTTTSDARQGAKTSTTPSAKTPAATRKTSFSGS